MNIKVSKSAIKRNDSLRKSNSGSPNKGLRESSLGKSQKKLHSKKNTNPEDDPPQINLTESAIIEEE